MITITSGNSRRYRICLKLSRRQNCKRSDISQRGEQAMGLIRHISDMHARTSFDVLSFPLRGLFLSWFIRTDRGTCGRTRFHGNCNCMSLADLVTIVVCMKMLRSRRTVRNSPVCASSCLLAVAIQNGTFSINNHE